LDLQSIEIATRMSVKALVDSAATRDFINSEYVISHNLPVRRLSQPIPVLNVDGSPHQMGGIAGVVNMVVDYKGHAERIHLSVTRLGSSTSSSVTPGSRNTIRRL
jgi:bifunctional ADP-heptose synthase (sugar kinase/adenylyltransferase)